MNDLVQTEAEPGLGKASAEAFLSYASPDRESAFRLCGLLEEKGIRCWIAPRDVTPGGDYAEEIIRAIEASTAMVLFLSAYANASVHVKNEVERATSKRKRVIPLRLEDVPPSLSLELHLATAHWVDAWRLSPDEVAAQLAAALRGNPSPGKSQVAPPRTEDRNKQRKIHAALGGRRGRVVALVFLAILCMVIPLAIWKFGLGSAGQEGPPLQEPATLAVQVKRNKEWGKLPPTVPLKNGDKLELLIKIPAKMYASLFCVDGQGRLTHLVNVPAQVTAFEKIQTVTVTGKPGTEFFMVCLSATGPVDAAQLRTLWDEQADWPSLPKDSVLQMEGGQVTFMQRSRDLELFADPQDAVQDRLKDFLRRAQDQVGPVLGIAFAHTDDP